MRLDGNMRSVDKKVSIVIPVLNEESGIRNTIRSIPLTRICKLGYDLEIIVIDGNSTDSTRDVAEQMGAKVLIEPRKGYGRAYKTGLAATTGGIIISMDGDGTYPAELIPECISIMNERDFDFITINRFAEMQDDAMSLSHRIGNEILSYAMRQLYSLDVKDSQSGMQIMKRAFIDRINLNSDGYPMSEEIKIIAFKFFKAQELNGKYYKRKGHSKLNTFKHGFSNLVYLYNYRKILRLAIVNPVESEIPSQKSGRNSSTAQLVDEQL
jgi:dolichol-phosphate hexosyltransferase